MRSAHSLIICCSSLSSEAPEVNESADEVGGFSTVDHADIRGSGNATERLEAFDMAAQEAVQGLIESKASKRAARPRQHHYEARQRMSAAADLELAEAATIDLRFFTRERT